MISMILIYLLKDSYKQTNEIYTSMENMKNKEKIIQIERLKCHHFGIQNRLE